MILILIIFYSDLNSLRPEISLLGTDVSSLRTGMGRLTRAVTSGKDGYNVYSNTNHISYRSNSGKCTIMRINQTLEQDLYIRSIDA